MRCNIKNYLIFVLVMLSTTSILYAADLDPHYKFSGVKAPTSPYKNTWGAFQTDLFSGSFSYNYKIEAPPGTNGLAPKLSISYNSHAAKGKAGWVGAGWDIPQSYIQRNIQYTRKNTGDDTYELYLDGAKHDLVYVTSEGRFHTKVESYLKVEWKTGATNEASGYWVVTAKDGTEYRFGYNPDSENMLATSDTSFTRYVSRWSLDRVKDSNGNCIYFTYSENPTSNDRGAVYLSKIEYNNDKQRVVEFVLEANDKPDMYLTMDQGSETREARRLSEVRVKVNGSLARKYKLTYSMNQAQNRSLLASINQYGSDGASSLPPVRFAYKGLTKSFGGQTAWPTPGGGKYILKAESDGDVYYDTLDVNGDGLPDYVKFDADCGDGSGCWHVWKNTRTGFTSSLQNWTIPADRNAIRMIRDVRDEEGKARNTRSAMMDFNRDGYTDLVWANGGTSLKIGANNGLGVFNLTSWTIPTAWIRDIKTVEYDSDGNPTNAPNVEQVFMDMNGDGLPDLVKEEGGNSWHIWRNTGSGLADYGAWGVPHANAYIQDFEKDDNDVEVTTFDMNGDGLTDIITGAANNWHVYLNTGSNFIDGGNWTPPGFGDDDLIDVDTTGNVKHEIVDLNGDGLPDLANPRSDTVMWDVYLNRGNGFSSPIQWWNPKTDGYTQDVEKDTGNVKRSLLDLNGDGLVDVVTRTSDANWDVWFNSAGPEDLLSTITDTLGGTVTVGYASSMQYSNTRLPFNYWLVNSVTTNNGMPGPHAVSATTGYSYAQGLYDYPTREFRGFGQVVETQADGSKIIHSYHQDEARKGKEYRSETRSGTDAPYAAIETAWSGDESSGIYVSNPARTDAYTYDGVAANAKVVRTEYANYDQYGNVGLEKRLGDIAESGDETFTYQQYVYNSSLWIVNKLKHRSVSGTEGGAKLRESWFYYDGAASVDSPPTKGNLTREEHWLGNGTNPVTGYEYDGYGNRIRVTDPENHISRTEYDATFHTFPEKSWNAKDHLTVKAFNPANGQVTKETDPNGFVSTYVYDVFQRKTKEIKPYDSESSPTTLIQYLMDGTAPEGVITSRRETAGAAGTVDTVQYVDGFGNLIQTRSEYGTGLNRVAVDVFYDTMGRVAKQSNPYLTDASQVYSLPNTAVPTVSYSYDTVGRPTVTTNPDTTQVTRSFDHWAVTETDENSHAKSYLFDSAQRLKRVVENNGGESYTTNYLYSPMGELVRIADHVGNQTTLEYDSLGRKVRMADPDLGAWSYGYDRVGNLTSQLDARNLLTAISYDALNRKTLVNYPNNPDISFLYDLNTKGTLSQVTDAAGTVSYGYDQRLRKIQETRALDGFSWTTKWSYDSLDRVTGQTYPDGQTVSFAYDAQGKLTAIPGILPQIAYTPAGQTSLKSFSNGKSTTYTFDLANQRLKGIVTPGIQNLSYTHDNVGNIKTITDAIAAKTESFGYDDLDRLTQAGDSGYSAGYQYNAIGNMQQSTRNGAQISYTYGNGAPPHAVAAMTAPLPVVGSFALAAGKAYTAGSVVTLDNVSFGSPASYMASEDPGFSGAEWLPYSEKPDFTLSSGFGVKTLYFKVQNSDGESAVVIDTIEYLPDTDGDGVPDTYDDDDDGDGITDTWEASHGMNRLHPADAAADWDRDGLTNLQEFLLGTNLWQADSDGDGVSDYSEIYVTRTNPNNTDSDGDTIPDGGDPVPNSRYQFAASENFRMMKGAMNAGGSFRLATVNSVKDGLGDQFGGVMKGNLSIAITPQGIDFGPQGLGGSATVRVTITNRGTSALNLGQITFLENQETQFGTQNDACSNQSLNAAAQCGFDVTYSPTSVGAKAASVSIPSSDPVSPLKTLAVAGYGAAAPVYYSLAFTRTGSGSGIVSSTPGSMACDADCNGQFDSLVYVTLKAVPSQFSLFSGWAGDCSGLTDCSFTMDADKSVTAAFDRDTAHQVRLDGSGQYYYSSILAAYQAADTENIIRMWGTDFTDDFTFGLGKPVTLKGGYDGSYSTNSGYTTLNGILTILNGSLTVENLVIK